MGRVASTGRGRTSRCPATGPTNLVPEEDDVPILCVIGDARRRNGPREPPWGVAASTSHARKPRCHRRKTRKRTKGKIKIKHRTLVIYGAAHELTTRRSSRHRGSGLRCRTPLRDDSGTTGRQCDPVRPDRRRTRCGAGPSRRRQESVLGGPQQGQALDRRQHAQPGGSGTDHRADHRPGRGGRNFPHQLPDIGLARLRGLAPAPRRT